ncbi:site-specific tyrosine recombinase XerC [Vibrio ruber DSM 16370]|uniref:Site-specific tyrosine recombinase XerC n=1 Tax=Vibrio ruber (strain DSM 16370 / JCM 11486 / BCRC 17186 / CECT 7878 / LMG 23124 / VR1) TaxID=1123498 RepID=A0A1R4LT70_VIBR1|nr:tyrosine-type recombinase/integrase [Vibrio ruber]SJN59653.1 site-specific tyrosine recombinase XerC [Vibrio ruber DSM 16370]
MLKKPILITKKTIIDAYKKQLCTFIHKEQLNELTQYQYSNSSLLAMVKDWNLFVEFCQHQHVVPYPASPDMIRLFLEKESRVRKFSTLRRYTVTITVLHKLLGYQDPIANHQVRLLLMSLRTEKKGDNSQADALAREHIEQLDTQLSTSKNIKDIRDLAIYHLMFECILKRAELRELCIEQLTFCSDAEVQVELSDNRYQLSPAASEAIHRWYQLIDTQSSPYVFRSIDRHQNIGTEKLNDSSIYRILRGAGKRLGIADLKFSGQSTRIGATQELYKQGMKIKEIQSFGRWQSSVMPSQYVGRHRQAEIEIQQFKSFKPWKP